MKKSYFDLKTDDGLVLSARGWMADSSPKAVIALIHGLGEHSGRYEHLADFLIGAGYALFSFDLRGHGRSQGKRGHAPGLDALMDDMSLFLSEVQKQMAAEFFFLYGHSMGGALVINHVLRRQPEIAGGVVTGPLIWPAFKPPAWKLFTGKIMRRLWPALTLPNGLNQNHISRDPEVVKAYRTDPLVHDRLSARLGMDILEAGLWGLAHAGKFKPPLLLMHGEADHIVSVDGSREFAAKAKRSCELKVWPDFYHEIHNEPEKDDVFAYLLGWLDRHV